MGGGEAEVERGWEDELKRSNLDMALCAEGRIDLEGDMELITFFPHLVEIKDKRQESHLISSHCVWTSISYRKGGRIKDTTEEKRGKMKCKTRGITGVREIYLEREKREREGPPPPPPKPLYKSSLSSLGRTLPLFWPDLRSLPIFHHSHHHSQHIYGP